MKQRHLFFSALPFTVITVACSVLAANFASAASQTWDGDSGTDANWITATNWVAAAVPGSSHGRPFELRIIAITRMGDGKIWQDATFDLPFESNPVTVRVT